MRQKTSIIILNYNTFAYTKLCIESIRKFTPSGSYELIVVDNASTDESAAWLHQQGDLKCIFNAENTGFPKGCNQGLGIASGTELLLLNNDTIVTPRWLVQLKAALYSSPGVGAVSCVTNKCSNQQRIEVPAYGTMEGLLAFAEPFNHTDAAKWKRRLNLVGFCLLFKREVYEKIGGLDEAFSPGNYEDDDYSLRVWQAGYTLLLCEDTYIHHFGSASFVKSQSLEEREAERLRYNALLERNQAYFLKKWGITESYALQHPTVEVLPDKLPAGSRIVVVGCSCGRDLFYLEGKYPEAELSGIAATEAEARIAGRAFSVQVCSQWENGMLEQLAGKYTYILLVEPLDDMEAPEALIGKLKSFLLPEGAIYCVHQEKLYCFRSDGRRAAVEKKQSWANMTERGCEGMIFRLNLANFDPTVRKLYSDTGRGIAAATLGAGSYIVDGTLECGHLNAHLLVGRYSSLAHRLVFEVGLNHDHYSVTSYPFEDIGVEDGATNHAFTANHYQIIIGSDVWIGCDVTILGGVHIGNGAVIGAGAVVSRDVPPYAIVAGNPAQVMKYRFDAETIGKLQQIKWWNWPADKIRENLPLMKDAKAFAAKFYTEPVTAALPDKEIQRLQKLRADGYWLAYFVMDWAAGESVWKKIVPQYLDTFAAADKAALILELGDAEKYPEAVGQLYHMIERAGSQAGMIISHQGAEELSLGVLRNADCFITSREAVSSLAVDYAADFGVQVLSGLDFAIFSGRK